MNLAMVGLGRMGANMARRLQRAGHEVVVHDVQPGAVSTMEEEGFTGAGSLADLVAALEVPRVVWVMVPAGVVGQTVEALAPLLGRGDVVIDGGNSHHVEAGERAALLAERDTHFVDVGVSGGIWGLEEGYCLMIGGDPEPVALLDPVFAALAPPVDAVPRSPGREGPPGVDERGYLHCGPTGAGHYTKMVHNGIEYGMMAAYAEGLALLDDHSYGIDTAAVTELWRRGTVVRSWLLDLTAIALREDPALGAFSGHVGDSGEGRWTVHAAVEQGIPAPVITASLYQRFSSRGNGTFGDKVLSAMRQQFGGHQERPADVVAAGAADQVRRDT